MVSSDFNNRDIELLKLELATLEQLFHGERSSFDTVRGALAVPLAVLTFAAFGFGSLIANAASEPEPGVSWVFTVGVFLSTFLSFLFFTHAVVVLRRFRFIRPDWALQFARIQSTVDALEQENASAGDTWNASTIEALQWLCDELGEATVILRDENAENQRILGSAFPRLLGGLFFLVFALLVLFLGEHFTA